LRFGIKGGRRARLEIMKKGRARRRKKKGEGQREEVEDNNGASSMRKMRDKTGGL
jgi:hypothetical protein